MMMFTRNSSSPVYLYLFTDQCCPVQYDGHLGISQEPAEAVNAASKYMSMCQSLSPSQSLSVRSTLMLPGPRPFPTSVKCYLNREWSKMGKQKEKKPKGGAQNNICLVTSQSSQPCEPEGTESRESSPLSHTLLPQRRATSSASREIVTARGEESQAATGAGEEELLREPGCINRAWVEFIYLFIF